MKLVFVLLGVKTFDTNWFDERKNYLQTMMIIADIDLLRTVPIAITISEW